VLARAEQHFGDVPASDRPTQEALHSRRRKRNPGVQKGGPVFAEQTEASVPANTGLQFAEEINRLNRIVGEDRDVAVMLDDRISALIPTDRRQTRRVTRPWSSPQSATE
jgi:hypothetical protein